MTATTKLHGMESRPGVAILQSSAKTALVTVNQTKVKSLSKILYDGYLWSPDRRAQQSDEVDPKSVNVIAFI